MKKHTLFLAAALLCSAFAVAEDLELGRPHIAVYGTAEVKVTPNEMLWSVTVKSEDKELSTVAAHHTATVSKVLDFLKALKVNEDKLQTSRMQFGEEWKMVNREHVKVGYFASTDISFTISDFNLYQTIWFGLAKIEGVSIQSTQYAHSDRIRFQNESRQKAALAAREKAAALAKTLGSQIDEPLKIEEVQTHQIYNVKRLSSNRAYSNDMGQASPTDSLALGKISFSTKVRVIFKLISP